MKKAVGKCLYVAMSLIGLGIPLGNVANKIERDDMRIGDMIFEYEKDDVIMKLLALPTR